MEQTISVMSMAMESTEQEKENEENHVAVETIKGNILPVDEEIPAENTSPDQENLQEKIPAEDTVPEEVALPEETPENADEPVGLADEQKASGAETVPDTMPSAAETAESYQKQGYYIVQAGDSLRQISYNIYQNYTMIEKICEVNGIENQDSIYIGQKIILPE